MSAATGYFVAGSSWLHRRNPLTKLLALRPGPAGRVPAAAGRPAGPARRLLVGGLVAPGSCVRPLRGAAHPGGPDRVDPRRQRPLLPGRHGRRWSGRAVRAHPRGPDLRADLRRDGSWSSSSPRSLFLFTTLADDLLEALIARGASHRIAFVILSAVQMVPRMQERAGSILDAQQARGLRHLGLVRAPAASPRAADRPGRPRLAGRRPRADLRARGARVRGAAGADGVPRRRRSAGRPLAAPGDPRRPRSRSSSSP